LSNSPSALQRHISRYVVHQLFALEAPSAVLAHPLILVGAAHHGNQIRAGLANDQIIRDGAGAVAADLDDDVGDVMLALGAFAFYRHDAAEHALDGVAAFGLAVIGGPDAVVGKEACDVGETAGIDRVTIGGHDFANRILVLQDRHWRIPPMTVLA